MEFDRLFNLTSTLLDISNPDNKLQNDKFHSFEQNNPQTSIRYSICEKEQDRRTALLQRSESRTTSVTHRQGNYFHSS